MTFHLSTSTYIPSEQPRTLFYQHFSRFFKHFIVEILLQANFSRHFMH